MHGRFETLRRELREWTCDYADRIRSWGPGTEVHVLCDRGLGSRDLWARIRELGRYPVLRHSPRITFRPTGGARVPVRSLGGGPGTFRVEAGEAFVDKPLPGTLIVLHAKDCEEPRVLLTDTPPEHTGASLYACRHWIEQGFRGLKRGGRQWGRTRRTDPVRVARHLLVLAVATLLAVAYGTRREQARARGLPPGRLRRPPAGPQPPLARVWLAPTPGPDRTAGLRCLSPPPPDARTPLRSPRPDRPCPDFDRVPGSEAGTGRPIPPPSTPNTAPNIPATNRQNGITARFVQEIPLSRGAAMQNDPGTLLLFKTYSEPTGPASPMHPASSTFWCPKYARPCQGAMPIIGER